MVETLQTRKGEYIKGERQFGDQDSGQDQASGVARTRRMPHSTAAGRNQTC